MKDFTLHRDAEGKEARWSFRFGKCADFQLALAAVKAVPVSERKYEEDKDRLWSVEANGDNQNFLSGGFDNFESCRATALAQLPLF